MYKYSFIGFDGSIHEVEVSKAVHHLLTKEENRIVKREEYRVEHLYTLVVNGIMENHILLSVQSTEDDFIEQELLRKIDLVLEQCTEKQRRRFSLYALHGFTMEEIARIENCDFTSVRQSINQVRKKLLKEIKNIF